MVTNLAIFVYTLVMTQSPIILVNSQQQNHISVLDRGLSYGDGVFETMLACHGDICLWQYHYERLQQGLQRLGIPLHHAAFIEHMQATKEHIGQQPAVVKLIATRGVGGRGYMPNTDLHATLISQISLLDDVFISDNQHNQRQGVEVHYCHTVLPLNHILAGIKSLNQLPYVLASQERQSLPVKEGVLFTQDDQLIEATARNIFLVKNGALYTPLLRDCGVAGVMRRLIIDRIAVSHNIAVHEVPLKKKDLIESDEIFLTNSISYLWPVIACEDNVWSVGATTTDIQQQVDEFLKQETSLSLSSFLSNYL